MVLEKFVYMKESNFGKTRWLLSYTRKCMKKLQKSGFRTSSTYKLESNKGFCFKFLTDLFLTNNQTVLKFYLKFEFSELIEE